MPEVEDEEHEYPDASRPRTMRIYDSVTQLAHVVEDGCWTDPVDGKLGGAHNISEATMNCIYQLVGRHGTGIRVESVTTTPIVWPRQEGVRGDSVTVAVTVLASVEKRIRSS